jgi:hypothetical protein
MVFSRCSGFLHKKTYLHVITEILLKVALITINQPTNQPTNQPISITFVSDLPVYQEESYDDKYHKQEGNSY